MDWQLYLLPAGLLGTYGGYAYHRYDTIRRDGRRWLSDYLATYGRRDQAQLVTLIGAVFPDFLISYFDATDPEEPPALSDVAIADAAADIAGESDDRSKAYLVRTRLTAPLVQAVVERLVNQLPQLAESFELTATVQEAISLVNVGRANSSAIQRRLSFLEILFLVQAIAAFGTATGLIIGAAFTAPTVFLIACAIFPAVALHAGYLELKRAAVRWSLTVELTPAELIRAN